MKQAMYGISYALMSPEGAEGSSGGSEPSTSFDSVGDAVAELDRRDQARTDEKAAARAAARENPPEADDEQPDTDSPLPDDDDEGEDDDESDEVANDDEQDAPDEPKLKADLTEIEQDGKKYAVPTALKDSFLRQADYTRKTQELSGERAQVQAAYEQTAQLSQGLQQQQQQLAQYAQAMLGQPPTADMIQSDPQGYLAQRAAYEQRVGQFQALMGQGQALTQQDQALQQQRSQQVRIAEEKALFEHIPELRDPAKKQVIASRMVDAAAKYGITPLEITSLMDNRQVRILKDFADMAEKLRRYESADKDVKKRLTNVPPKVQRPSSATQDGGQKESGTAAKSQFMKSGRTMKDVARWARNSS